MLKKWDKLPKELKSSAVKPYYEILKRKQISLILKRLFDFIVSFIMLIILAPLILIISIIIMIDSKGGAFFRQERITKYNKKFKIFKFRTMVKNAEQLGTQVTTKNDMRITNIGKFLRKYRIDEIPQLINIFLGQMSFVGTRPEVEKYVKKYAKEMYATLLLPAGVTSEASIKYKDEGNILEKAINVDDTYIKKVLPEKMKYNLDSIKEFSLIKELKTMIKTIIAVLK